MKISGKELYQSLNDKDKIHHDIDVVLHLLLDVAQD